MSDKYDEIRDMEALDEILDDDIQDEADKTKTQEESATETEIKVDDDSDTVDESESDVDPDPLPAITEGFVVGSDFIVPTKSTSPLAIQESFPVINFEPKSKQELDAILSELWKRKRATDLMTYYLTGKALNKGREKWTYGEKDMEKLAESLETSTSNLYKACKFAEDYSEEQVKQLLRGRFAMSWRNIAQNQSVPSIVLIGIYDEAKSPAEFCNAVTKYKEEVNSSKDRSEGGQQEDENQQEEIENLPGQDPSRPDDGDSIVGEGLDDPNPILSEDEEDDDLDSDNVHDDSNDNDDSTNFESDQTRTEPIDPRETVDVQVLTTKIADLEKSIIEKDERITELETKNAALQHRIKELEGKQETSGANSESIKETESAEESPK